MQKLQFRNKYYLQDFKYVKMFVPALLNVLGVWPSLGKKKSTCKKIIDSMLIFFSYCMLFATLIPNSLFWVFKGNTHIRLRMLPIYIYALTIVIKYSILVIGQDRIRRCWKYIEEDWRNVVNVDARNIMLNSAKTSKRLAIMCGCFFYTGGLSIRLMPLLYSRKMSNQYNITIRLLPSPVYLFSLDTQATPIYEILYSLQGMTGFVTLTIATSVFSFIIVFVMHVCGQLKILMILMKEFVEESQEKEIDKKLADIVKQQIRIRNFLQLVQQAINQINVMDICAGTLYICIQGYFLLLEWKNHNSAVMISYTITCNTAMLNLFLFCYIGNQVIEQAEEVALMTCKLEWYRLPHRKARQIVLLVIMSNKPIKITAAKIVDLSLRTFGQILQTALAYLNVLRSLMLSN